MNKKKFFAGAAVFAVASSAFVSSPFSFQSEAYAATEKQVTASWLTVRSGIGASNKAIDWIPSKTKVTVLSTKSGWDHIQYGNGKKGYVDNDYLKTITSSSTRTVTAYWLTLRDGPEANKKAIGYLEKGTKVNILSYSGDWAKVKVGNKTGYVHESYLSGSKSSVPTSSPSLGTKTVTAYWLTLRDGAGVNNKAIDYLKKGTKVTVLSTKGEWVQVKVGNTTGFVHGDFLSGASTSNPQPTPKPSSPTTGSYKVKTGDTLWSISRTYNMSVDDLKSINKLTSNIINVGQTLKVSGKASTPAPVTGILSGKEIVIDPGHGGRFAGAQGYVKEEVVNLSISLKVQKQLQSMGAKVIMTRTSDVACTAPGVTYAKDLACRPGVAIKNKSDMFVSIHSNAGEPAANGTETFYRNSNRGDYKLAKNIYDELTTTAGLRGRRVAYADFAVLRHSGPNIPSALVETAFVTNKNDAATLNSSTQQDKIAKAIANGISRYYK